MTDEQKAGLVKINSAIHSHNQRIVKQGHHYKGSKLTVAQQQHRRKEQKIGLDKINKVIHEHNQKFMAKHKPKVSAKPSASKVQRPVQAKKPVVKPKPVAKPQHMPKLSRVDRRKHQIKARHKRILHKIIPGWMR